MLAVTGTEKDAFGNTKTGYSGGASLSGTLGYCPSCCQSAHTSVVAAATYTCPPALHDALPISNGTASANVTGYNAESGDTVTATDSGKTGTTNSFDIVPAGLENGEIHA